VARAKALTSWDAERSSCQVRQVESAKRKMIERAGLGPAFQVEWRAVPVSSCDTYLYGWDVTGQSQVLTGTAVGTTLSAITFGLLA
jgi:hypothetical protein